MVFSGAALPAAHCCLKVGPLGPADGAAEGAELGCGAPGATRAPRAVPTCSRMWCDMVQHIKTSRSWSLHSQLVQAYLAMPCLGLVTDLPLIRWASRASDGTQGPSGRWSESLTMSSFEKISPRLRTPFSAASTRRLGLFHDRSHGPPCPRGPD